MLTTDEIKTFINEDDTSLLKRNARLGRRYYDGLHDILDYRLFYYNADGNLVEDKTRANFKIPHLFFTELVDQAVLHIMSGSDGFFKSTEPALQKELDVYFNYNEGFAAELQETLTCQQVSGFGYMYAYKGNADRLEFENAECIGVIEVEGKYTDSKKDHVIYRYVDRVGRKGKTQWKILVIDEEETWYYIQTDKGDIVPDSDIQLNPRPHAVYTNSDGKLYSKELGMLPIFRIDNNKRKMGHLHTVKGLIDDYDLMASSLTNNLVDFDKPIYAVRGFRGDNLDELQLNLKTKKMMGVDDDGGIDVLTVDIPFQARLTKLELDEKNIYRSGMGLNTAGLKDTSATTNLAIQAAYTLLDMRCSKMIVQLKQFFRNILKPVIAEINEQQGTDYDNSMVYFEFNSEIMSSATENAQKALTEAQEEQTRINTLLGLATYFDNETLMKKICEVLDIDYEEIKGKLPDPDESMNSLYSAAGALEGITAD